MSGENKSKKLEVGCKAGLLIILCEVCGMGRSMISFETAESLRQRDLRIADPALPYDMEPAVV